MERKVKVLTVRINAISKSQLLAFFLKVLSGSKKERLAVSKVNTEFLLRALKNKEFKGTLESFDLNLADGVGVLWAAKYLSLPLIRIPVIRQLQAIWQMIYSGASLVFYPAFCRAPIPEAFRGTDAMRIMLKIAEKEKAPIFLFGAPEKTLEKTVKNIQSDYQDILIAGYRHGYDFSDAEVVEEINGSGATILFVALGSPMQEFWIRNNFQKLRNVRVSVGEGGTFEFLAGTFKRAPKWMRKLGLEWLWRLLANRNKTTGAGSRVHRVWNAVPVFIYETVKYKLKENE